jgi:hypothetical protein
LPNKALEHSLAMVRFFIMRHRAFR